MLCLIVILNIDLELGDVTRHDVMVIKNYSIILTGMQRFISPQSMLNFMFQHVLFNILFFIVLFIVLCLYYELVKHNVC